ncbi:MAG TPA: hypothetical protein VNL71_07360, partial [Chloroflexota bacterium]|nr:hypothetical protein [Chloroflexota bacterium]
MAEGIAVAGKVISGGVHDDPDSPPPPGPDAVKGWTWARKSRAWVPKVRGPNLWQPEGAAGDGRGDGGPDRDSAPGDGAGPGAEGGQVLGFPDRDPDPAWMGEETREAMHPISEQIVLTAEDRKNTKAFVALLYGPVADTLYTLDPYCFGELDSNASGIIDAINDCVLASPKVAQMVAHGSLVPYIKLAQ